MTSRERHQALGLFHELAWENPEEEEKHANVAAAAPHNPGFQTVILPGSPGMRSIHPHKWHRDYEGYGRDISVGSC